MAVELKVPEVGESITEVQIGEWLKSSGEQAAQDEALVVIETDKVTVELPAPIAGRITKVLKKAGDSAEVGEVIGYMEEGEGDGAEESRSAGKGGKKQDSAKKGGAKKGGAEEAAEEEPQKKASPKKAAGKKAAKRAEPAEQPAEEVDEDAGGEPSENGDEGDAYVMPAARRLIEEHDLDAASIDATGPGGRLLKEDVQRFLEGGGEDAEEQDEDEAEETEQAPARSSSAAGKSAEEGAEEEVVPMSPMRKRIAQRLVEAQQTAALLTTFNEIDMTAVKALREEHQPRFQEQHGVKLGFMSFFVKAAIEGLKAVPAVNAEVRGTDVVYKKGYHVGIAVGGGKGLVVPVLKDAERLGFAEIERAIADFAQRAKTSRLTLDELQGGTFTISNGGIYGSLLSTPIVNPPQSGILGLHAIQDRPMAVDGQVVVRPMMYVALTYDHRVVDGREAVTFLRRVKECVETPARILLES